MKREEMEKEYKRLAKKADARLRNLEKYEQKGYQIATRWAYADAMESIERIGGRKRFDLKLKHLTDKEIKYAIKDVERFLEMKTSSIKEIKTIQTKRTTTLNNKYGINLSTTQWADIVDYINNTNLNEKYGSNVIMLTLGKVARKGEDIENILKDVSDKKIKDFAPLEKMLLNDIRGNMYV